MTIAAPEIHSKSASEAVPVSVDWTAVLEPGDTLTGTPTAAVTSIPSGLTNLTIGTIMVNVATLEVNGATVAIGLATQCKVSGGTAGTLYEVAITATTTNGYTRVRAVRVQVV